MQDTFAFVRIASEVIAPLSEELTEEAFEIFQKETLNGERENLVEDDGQENDELYFSALQQALADSLFGTETLEEEEDCDEIELPEECDDDEEQEFDIDLEDEVEEEIERIVISKQDHVLEMISDIWVEEYGELPTEEEFDELIEACCDEFLDQSSVFEEEEEEEEEVFAEDAFATIRAFTEIVEPMMDKIDAEAEEIFFMMSLNGPRENFPEECFAEDDETVFQAIKTDIVQGIFGELVDDEEKVDEEVKPIAEDVDTEEYDVEVELEEDEQELCDSVVNAYAPIIYNELKELFIEEHEQELDEEEFDGVLYALGQECLDQEFGEEYEEEEEESDEESVEEAEEEEVEAAVEKTLPEKSNLTIDPSSLKNVALVDQATPVNPTPISNL